MKSRNQQGFTLIELLIVVAIIGIIAAIAIPGLLRARMSGNEASAIGSMRAVASAQSAYTASAGSGGYATSLVILGAPCGTVGQGFIGGDLGKAVSTTKSGYLVTMVTAGAVLPADCNLKPTGGDYYATAVPTTIGSSGNRAFATSASSTVYQTSTGAAPTSATVLAGTATPIQ